MSLLQETRQNFPHLMKVLTKPVSKIEVAGDVQSVLAVHGVFGSWNEGGILTYLQENNIESVLAGYGLLLKGINHYLPLVDEEIKKNRDATLIGFSAGGLILLEWARQNGFEDVKKIITVGTPFNGVNRLFGIVGKTVRDISPDSELLKGIRELHPPNDKVLSVFCAPDKDFFIPDPESIKLNWPRVIVGAKNHGDIQSDKKWLENILDCELGLYERKI